jgi:hypothetical protein
MTQDLRWTQQEVLSEAERLRGLVRENFLRDGALLPVSFVFATKHLETQVDQVGVIVVPVVGEFDEETKDTYSQFIRSLTKATAAVGVMFASEAWILDGGGMDEYEKYRGHLQDHPDRKEVIVATLEHSRFGRRIWVAEISRLEGEAKPLLLDWNERDEPGTNAVGLFVNILPPTS